MSDISNAEAYRIAADWFDTRHQGGTATDLRIEAARLDRDQEEDLRLGDLLLEFITAGPAKPHPREIGSYARSLIDPQTSKLKHPPSPDELKARDDIE